MQSSSFTELSNLDFHSAELESIKPVSTETDMDSTNDDDASSPIANGSSGPFLDCLKDIGACNEFITELGFMNESGFDELTEVVDGVPEGNDSGSDSDSGSSSGSDIPEQSYGSSFSVFDYYATRLSPIMEEPESADYEDTKHVGESSSGYAKFENEDEYKGDDEDEDEYEDEEENNLQNNFQLASPCFSFYSESFIPLLSCVSSIVAPVPVPPITNISSAFHKRSSQNVQESFIYLDVSPSAVPVPVHVDVPVEKKSRKSVVWAHICKWFHGAWKTEKFTVN
ncbi:unnamed protein product [Ambrosiozyma monospora]|uniref:Unnamed protein product n=1 Tax=Ambrosiozyma monospora TaxID=43982 RepID=A0A9W6YU70_AMBMO|nr:unnamed protein product [Ambrosiozyma monospora]